MKVAVCVVTYNDHRFLKPFLKQIPDWVEKILFLVSERPWNGLMSPDAYKTTEILNAHPDKRIETHKMNWPSEALQRTWGLAKLYDYDWVITIDTDEFFTAESWNDLRLSLNGTHLGTNNVVCKLKTYWKDFDHVFEPGDTHKPSIAVRPKKVVFFDKRICTDDTHLEVHFPMHHLSWVRTDAEVKQKIQNYAHALDFDQDKWYNEVWKAWTPEMRGIRPYGSEKNTKAIGIPLPQEIRDLFG